MKNYYEFLGLEQNASTEDITKRLIERAHNCTPEEIELYKEISTILCSPDRRKDYNQSLHEYSVSVEENIPQPVYGPPKKEEYEVRVMENIPQPVYGPPKKEEYEVRVMENIPQPVYGPPKKEEYEVRVMENIPQPVYGPPKKEEYEVRVMENIPQPVYGPPKREEIEIMLADKPKNTTTSSNHKK